MKKRAHINIRASRDGRSASSTLRGNPVELMALLASGVCCVARKIGVSAASLATDIARCISELEEAKKYGEEANVDV